MSQTPRRVGARYELGPVLGRGGMADVRRAHDPVLGRDVAVKLLRTTDVVDRSRFDSEARLLALLTHEHVVTVLDAGVDDDHDGGLAWLALELVDGDTLADRFERGPMEPVPLARLGAQIAAALQHAHTHGVVHRDVKPSNVLIDRFGRARLTDFGIARLVDDTAALTMTGHTIGTAAYLAPEQVTGAQVTTASDVYALGLLLLEGLTGRREYAGPAVEAALARLHRGPLVPVSLPTGWPGLIAAMTAREPGERPSAEAVAQRLTSLHPHRQTAPVLPPPSLPPPPPSLLPPPPPPLSAEHTVTLGPVAGAAPPARRPSRRVLAGVAAALALVVALSALVLDGAPGDDAPPAAAAAAAGGSTPAATPSSTASPTPTATAQTRAATPRVTPAPTPTVTKTSRPSPVKPQAKPEPKAKPKAKAKKPQAKGKGKAQKPQGKSQGKGKSKSKGKRGR